MITFTLPQIDALERAAVAAYPAECCGLLLGREDGQGAIDVTRVIPSRNLAAPARRDRFEVDPASRLAAMRMAAGDERLVGFYHSHPDHPAAPSSHDRTQIFEPELIWIIIAVDQGRADKIAAFRPLPDGADFREIGVRTAASDRGAS